MSERIICNDAGGELREEIVRCRDCDFFASDRLGERCTLMEFRTVGMSNGFCSWGMRREEPMTATEKFKPCPFCGGRPEVMTSSDGFTSVGCMSCNPVWGTMIQGADRESVMRLWNVPPRVAGKKAKR